MAVQVLVQKKTTFEEPVTAAALIGNELVYNTAPNRCRFRTSRGTYLSGVCLVIECEYSIGIVSCLKSCRVTDGKEGAMGDRLGVLC